MLPPGAKGTISYIAPAGHYTVNDDIIEVDFMGQKKVRLHDCTSAFSRHCTPHEVCARVCGTVCASLHAFVCVCVTVCMLGGGTTLWMKISLRPISWTRRRCGHNCTSTCMWHSHGCT